LKALILYTQLDSLKNEYFIDLYQEEAKKRDIQLSLVTKQHSLQQDVDFVINKTRDHFIAKAFEEEGIPVFNTSFVTEIANDKWSTYEYLNKKIKAAGTYIATEDCPIPFPVVVKPRHGHGGARVVIANNDEEYYAARNYTTDYTRMLFGGPEKYDGAIVQPLMKPGQDLRVYVLGREILASVLRTSEKDFRSNYSLGGKVRLVNISDNLKETINIITDQFHFGLVGIDFIFDDNGTAYLNEIEDAVGARMLYELIPDINLPAKHLDFILKELGK